MAKVIVSSAAEIDFTESLCWYADHDIDAASDFDLAFEKAIENIAASPGRFPMCDKRHHYFLMKRFPFRVIYRIVKEEVVIIAVAHASRDPGYWTKR